MTSTTNDAPSRLEARGLTVHRGAHPVLVDLSFEVTRGELVALVGPNGVGKTTLLRALAGLLRPSQGEVVLDAVSIASLTPRARAKLVVPLLDPPPPTFGFTVRELVLMGRHPHLGRGGLESEADLAATDAALDALDLTHLASRPYPGLSSGEQQRTALARVVCQAPRFLLLDEPTSRLDPAHVDRVICLLRRLAALGQGVLVVAHDLDLAARMADRVVLLGGIPPRVVAAGEPSAVLTPSHLQDVYGVPFIRVDEVAHRTALVTGTRVSPSRPPI